MPIVTIEFEEHELNEPISVMLYKPQVAMFFGQDPDPGEEIPEEEEETYLHAVSE